MISVAIRTSASKSLIERPYFYTLERQISSRHIAYLILTYNVLKMSHIFYIAISRLISLSIFRFCLGSVKGSQLYPCSTQCYISLSSIGHRAKDDGYSFRSRQLLAPKIVILQRTCLLKGFSGIIECLRIAKTRIITSYLYNSSVLQMSFITVKLLYIVRFQIQRVKA